MYLRRRTRTVTRIYGERPCHVLGIDLLYDMKYDLTVLGDNARNNDETEELNIDIVYFICAYFYSMHNCFSSVAILTLTTLLVVDTEMLSLFVVKKLIIQSTKNFRLPVGFFKFLG